MHGARFSAAHIMADVRVPWGDCGRAAMAAGPSCCVAAAIAVAAAEDPLGGHAVRPVRQVGCRVGLCPGPPAACISALP